MNAKTNNWLYRLFASLSFFAILCLIYQIISRQTNLPEIPGDFRLPLFILVSGGIGFLTNWLAIKMIFRPREKVPWLFFWKQGLLPREQARFARVLGDVGERNLLNQEAIKAGLENPEISDKIGKATAEEIQNLLHDDELRKIISQSLEDGIRIHGPGFLHRVRPKLRQELDDFLRELLSVDVIKNWVRDTIIRFAESRAFRKALALWMMNETSKDGPMQRIMGLLQEQFYRYREKNPVRGFLAEQFVLDWEQIRESIVRTLRSDEATEELAQILIQASGSIIERLEKEETDTTIHKLRQAMIDRMLDWIEEDGINQVSDRLKRLTNSPDFWNAFNDSIEDLFDQLPSALLDVETGNLSPVISDKMHLLQLRVIEHFPVSQIVEKQIIDMNTAELEGMAFQVAEQEFSAIQILGFIVGGICGMALYYAL